MRIQAVDVWQRFWKICLTIVSIVSCSGKGMNYHDLFDELKPHINLAGGTLSGDDTVIDKPYSEPKLTE